jgi:hypothetical protein
LGKIKLNTPEIKQIKPIIPISPYTPPPKINKIIPKGISIFQDNGLFIQRL